MHSEGEPPEVWRLPGYACTEALSLEDLIGVPFKLFGRDPKTGLDCTGLKIEFWRRNGVEITDPRDDMLGCEGEFREVEHRKFGDSICVDAHGSGYPDHIAIYLGMGLCIHVHASRGVEVIPVMNIGGRVVSILRLVHA